MKKIDIAWVVDLALLAIGFIAAVIFRLNALVVNVACSIIASAFVGLINLIANGAERKATEITQDWGLEGIYEDGRVWIKKDRIDAICQILNTICAIITLTVLLLK